MHTCVYVCVRAGGLVHPCVSSYRRLALPLLLAATALPTLRSQRRLDGVPTALTTPLHLSPPVLLLHCMDTNTAQ